MKQYKINMLKSLTTKEKIEALELLSIPTPDILDWLIESHKKAVKKYEKLDFCCLMISEETIQLWKKLIDIFEKANSLFKR